MVLLQSIHLRSQWKSNRIQLETGDDSAVSVPFVSLQTEPRFQFVGL